MALAIVLFASAGIAAIDQLIKYFIVRDLAPVKSVSVIDGLFSLTYVENRGVAFGLFQNHIWIFAIITALLIGVFIWLIVTKRITGGLFYTAAALMIGGGIGNLIDRVFRGFVVDYLSLSFFPPVCNFADYCITIGAALLVVVFLFRSGKGKSTASEKADALSKSEPSDGGGDGNGEETTAVGADTETAESRTKEESNGS